MNVLLIFIWIYAAMIAMAFWEAYAEGRNPWDKRKLGWKVQLSRNFVFPAYHFYVFWVMWPLLLTLPFVIYGWDSKLFGVLASAYFSGMVLEDFFWFIVNPAVKFSEFWTDFTDYYPWIKVGKKKIIPWGYVLGVAVAVLFWWFLWR
ncbi:hypothetical protein A3K73_03925 [Candidatus Pacearchaeota archaeon RBG_13_36_9]|nr:MAG: hypothetical protein A3K73_03925 [Candidatus Pacearchaeota archaeon RBG_13_36_9]